MGYDSHKIGWFQVETSQKGKVHHIICELDTLTYETLQIATEVMTLLCSVQE